MGETPFWVLPFVRKDVCMLTPPLLCPKIAVNPLVVDSGFVRQHQGSVFFLTLAQFCYSFLLLINPPLF